MLSIYILITQWHENVNQNIHIEHSECAMSQTTWQTFAPIYQRHRFKLIDRRCTACIFRVFAYNKLREDATSVST